MKPRTRKGVHFCIVNLHFHHWTNISPAFAPVHFRDLSKISMFECLSGYVWLSETHQSISQPAAATQRSFGCSLKFWRTAGAGLLFSKDYYTALLLHSEHVGPGQVEQWAWIMQDTRALLHVIVKCHSPDRPDHEGVVGDCKNVFLSSNKIFCIMPINVFM